MNKSSHTPPRSPNQSKNQSFTEEKENVLATSTIKKLTQTNLKNTLLQSIHNNNPIIPQFYFPKDNKNVDEHFLNS